LLLLELDNFSRNWQSGAMTLSKVTISIMTFATMGVNVKLMKSDTQPKLH
jgi:hypothetical protein